MMFLADVNLTDQRCTQWLDSQFGKAGFSRKLFTETVGKPAFGHESTCYAGACPPCGATATRTLPSNRR